MKVGDYVAKITNDWQKQNKWMEFPDEKPEPLGIIVSLSPIGPQFWNVLTSCGSIESFDKNHLVVINEALSGPEIDS